MERIDFVCDGHTLSVRPGVTVAAALLDAGVTAFRRSVSGEARAPLCAMGTCFECRVTIDGVPHRRSCQLLCRPGMVVETATTVTSSLVTPSLVTPSLVARPEVGPTIVEELHADVAVVGAGPAGIAAATTAREAGASVVLIDDNLQLGGQIWRHARAAKRPIPEPVKKRAWRERFERAGIKTLFGAAIYDAAGPTRLFADLEVANDGERAAVIACERLIIATGATERFSPVPGWTLPRVVGVGGLQALLKSGLDLTGQRVVFAGTGPLLLAVAAALREAGGHIVAIEEEAPFARVAKLGASLLRRPAKLVQAAALAARTRGRVHYGARLQRVEAVGTSLRADFVTASGTSRSHVADWVAIGQGLVPRTRLARLLGCQLEATGAGPAILVDDEQRSSVAACFAAGECTGIAGVEAAIAAGIVAGLAASGRRAEAMRAARRARRERGFGRLLERSYPARQGVPTTADDTLLCRCEDVPLAALAGHGSARDLKLKTRCGMGACQGRVCGPIVAAALGDAEDRVRPPLFPVRLGRMLAAGCEYDSRDELSRGDAGDHDAVHGQ